MEYHCHVMPTRAGRPGTLWSKTTEYLRASVMIPSMFSSSVVPVRPNLNCWFVRCASNYLFNFVLHFFCVDCNALNQFPLKELIDEKFSLATSRSVWSCPLPLVVVIAVETKSRCVIIRASSGSPASGRGRHADPLAGERAG